MPCEPFKEDMQAYLDNELPPPRRLALEAHLKACPECRAVQNELETVSSVLAQWKDRKPNDKLEFMLQFQLATEELPAPETIHQPAARPTPRRAVTTRLRAHVTAARWMVSGWRPALAVTSILMFFVVMATLQSIRSPRRAPKTPPRPDVTGAFAAAGSEKLTSDSSIYAAVVGKKAVQAPQLNPSTVASADVVYSFLASLESPADRRAGGQLINLISMRPRQRNVPVQTSLSGIPRGFPGLFARNLYAGGIASDPFALPRRYELQGRLKTALNAYSSLYTGPTAARAHLAAGSLMLRMGEVEGAVGHLEAAAKSTDPVVKSSAGNLLVEVAAAREAISQLPQKRETARNAADWFDVALLEVNAYDFRRAASSFMRAANDTSSADAAMQQDALFRAAWCSKEYGQLGTAQHGFRKVRGAAEEPSELEYAAAIEEAVALSRAGRFQESVDVCAAILKKPAPTSSIESLAYFHKGCVELRDLQNHTAATESLRRVTSDGRGKLSYAANFLLDANGR